MTPSVAALTLVVSLTLLIWIFIGYPAFLRVAVALRGPRAVRKADIAPTITLVVSAYNEADVIHEKVANALSLDYPADRLQVVVISDASSDGTDDIVRAFSDARVRLCRQDERRGKTAGLNRFVPELTCDVVVFSDANAIYERDALRKLVRNFADPEVGCVTGEARYLPADTHPADAGEQAYWNYEIQLKRLETELGSSVGGDGAIYAIRAHLWRNLPDTAINDFLNPLQIVAAGWRSVYEPDAICWERTAGDTVREYRRRVRIVGRSWRAIFQAPHALNPLRVGFFAVSLLSHKLLRWFAGVFAAVAGAAVAALLLPRFGSELAAVLPWALGLLGALLLLPQARRVASLLLYFTAIYCASTVGLIRGTFGLVSGTWTPPREDPGVESIGRLRPWARRSLLVVGAMLVLGSLAIVAIQMPSQTLAGRVFWVAVATMAYVYVGYPLLMLAYRTLVTSVPVTHGATPQTCLLLPAHNEAVVIEAKLRNALALDYPADRLTILVVADGCTDDTVNIVRQFESRGVRLLEVEPRQGKSAALNRGIAQCASEVVVFSDANTMLETDALRVLVEGFADPQVGAVSGDVALIGERATLASPEDLYYRYERWLQSSESSVGSMVGADGALYAIRRALYSPPPTDTILDDMAIPIAVVKRGFRVVFEPMARATEHGSRSAREELSRKTRVAAGAIQLLLRAPGALPWRNLQFIFSFVSHKVLRWMSPWLFVVAFIASARLAPTRMTFAAITLSQLVVFAAGLAGCAPALRRYAPIAMAHYVLLVHAAALLGAVRGVLRLQPVTWQRFERTCVPDAAQESTGRRHV